MKFSKSLAVAALALAVLGGCGKSNTPNAGSASPSPQAMSSDEAKAALLAAAVKTAGTSYKLTFSVAGAGADNVTAEGAADGKAQKMQLKMTVPGQATPMEVRVVGTDFYLAGVPSTPAGKWIHMNTSQIPGGASTFNTTEQSFGILYGITDITVNPDGSFAGKADPALAASKVPDANAKDALQKIAAAAKSQPVPFTATVKDGYLSDFTSTMPTDVNGVTINAEIKVHLSDFGSPVTVDVPAKADTLESPTS
jgi:hypothetical protein